jgi:hypothetical protein
LEHSPRSQDDPLKPKNSATSTGAPDIGRKVLALKKDLDTHTNIFNILELTDSQSNLVKVYNKIEIDSLMELVQKDERYIRILIITACFITMFSSAMGYIGSFTLSEPTFTCPDGNY